MVFTKLLIGYLILEVLFCLLLGGVSGQLFLTVPVCFCSVWVVTVLGWVPSGAFLLCCWLDRHQAVNAPLTGCFLSFFYSATEAQIIFVVLGG